MSMFVLIWEDRSCSFEKYWYKLNTTPKAHMMNITPKEIPTAWFKDSYNSRSKRMARTTWHREKRLKIWVATFNGHLLIEYPFDIASISAENYD